MTSVSRLAIVASHPIQYFTPLYRALARDSRLDVHVIFASRIGLEKAFDHEMGVEVAWATDLVSGYSHEFLPEADTIKRVAFREVDNPSVGAALRGFRPDATIIHGYGMMTMLRALAWCRRNRVPAIMTSDSSVHSTGAGFRRVLKLATLPMLLRQFSAILTMSDRGETYLANFRYPRTRMFRAPPMIDQGFWNARKRRCEARREARERLDLASGDVVLLCVGKLIPGKRVMDIFEAIRHLGADGPASPRVRLLVAGDGGQRAELQAFVAAHGLPARFLGFVNIDALPELYCAADALVHPSELEQYGMVVLEAAVLGLPLILSDRVGAIGATSIARPGENAILYPCGDVEALSRAIGHLLRHPAELARMGEASLKISLDHQGGKSVEGVLGAIRFVTGGERPRASRDDGNIVA